MMKKFFILLVCVLSAIILCSCYQENNPITHDRYRFNTMPTIDTLYKNDSILCYTINYNESAYYYGEIRGVVKYELTKVYAKNSHDTTYFIEYDVNHLIEKNFY